MADHDAHDHTGIPGVPAGGYAPGGTDVAVADGGTGASTAAAARTNLGLVIGTDVQAFDADIPTVAASQAEMEAGTEAALRSMSPLRVSQAIAALGGGGGGGAPTGVKYVVAAADGTLTNEIILPALAGSIDIPAGGGSDHEFDAALSGWTTLGSPDALNANSDALSHLHIVKNATATLGLHGLYRASPSMPFTMTAKLSDAYIRADYNIAGIGVAEATPGKISGVDVWSSGGNPVIIGGDVWTNPTSWSAGTATLSSSFFGGFPIYLRIVATTSTNVAYYWSDNGMVWRLINGGHNPSMTIASVVLYVESGNATYPGEAFFDWVRFT